MHSSLHKTHPSSSVELLDVVEDRTASIRVSRKRDKNTKKTRRTKTKPKDVPPKSPNPSGASKDPEETEKPDGNTDFLGKSKLPRITNSPFIPKMQNSQVG